MSESPAKLADIDYISGSLQQNEEDEAIEFYVTLCHDVLFEVLQVGDRRRLTKLERVGRRFHRIVEYFEKKPFLRLNLLLRIGNGMEAHIGKPPQPHKDCPITEISLSDLSALPRFIRFDVLLRFENMFEEFTFNGTISGKCHLFGEFLQPIKAALINSKISLLCIIDQDDPTRFNDHSVLLDYLRNGLLPICDSSRQYEFSIHFKSDKNSAKEVIASILQFPQIIRCSNVGILLWRMSDNQIQLPIDVIAQWLNQHADLVELIDRTKQEKFLKIDLGLGEIQNVSEMCGQLMEAFNKSKVLTQQYTFLLEFYNGMDVIEEQTVTNKRTNEEFSVRETRMGFPFLFRRKSILEIKRAAKKKKN